MLSPTEKSGHEHYSGYADGDRRQRERVMRPSSAGSLGIRWVVLNRHLVADRDFAPKPAKLYLGSVTVARLIGERDSCEVDGTAELDSLYHARGDSMVQVEQGFVEGEPAKDEE